MKKCSEKIEMNEGFMSRGEVEEDAGSKVKIILKARMMKKIYTIRSSTLQGVLI